MSAGEREGKDPKETLGKGFYKKEITGGGKVG